MNRRGKQVTLGVMGLGLAVVLVLVITHWGTVRNHVEAWHFQLTTETETLEPHPQDGPLVVKARTRHLCGLLADHSGQPVILAAEEHDPLEHVPLHFTDRFEGELTYVAKKILEANGWRVLQQLFPRRAYVVIPHEGYSREILPPFQEPVVEGEDPAIQK